MVNKLGPHVILPSEAAMRWVQHAGVVKSLDRPDTLRAAPDSALRIFRHYFPNQPLDADPSWVAGEILGALGGYRHPLLYVEAPYNEAYQFLGQGLEQYVTLTRAVTNILHANGVKVAGFCFSVAQPQMSDWAYVASQGFAGVDALAVHQYWGNQGLTEECALRHRQVHKFLHGDHPPFLASECGRDAVEGGQAGWQNCNISGEQYLNECSTFADAIDQDSYVLGATLYTAGPTPDWEKFSTDVLDTSRFYVTEATMPLDPATQATIDQLKAQNALLTDALIAIRENRWTGADGVDGYIAAMRGGSLPDGYAPSYPPKA